MSIKYEKTIGEPNTVQLLAHLAQIGTWSAKDYTDAGFRLMQTTISGCGPEPGKTSTVSAPWIDELGLSWKLRRQCRMDNITLGPKEVGKTMKALLKTYPNVTFRIESVTLIDTYSDHGIALRPRGQGSNRFLYVWAIDGLSHNEYETDSILKLMHDLVRRTCRITPTEHTPGTVCLMKDGKV